MATLRQPTLREQIKAHVIGQIDALALRPGDQIMSQNQLASLFGTTAVTVHKALTELADAGVVYRQKGAGTFVGPEPTRIGRICLVLPGEHLDDPAVNPHHWAYVQSLIHGFMRAAGSDWVFSTRAFTPDCDLATAARELASYDGVFFHHSKEPRRLLQHLATQTRTPLICFGLPRPWLDASTIDHDMVGGTAAGVAHLLALGHRRIGLVRSDAGWADPWQRGYEQALQAAGITPEPAWILRVREGLSSGADAAAALLADDRGLDAVFVESDLRALGLIDALSRAGVAVPQDLAVMGYDGLETSTRQPPYLTSVSVPFVRMIQLGLDILSAGDGGRTPRRHHSLRGEIIAGLTCATPVVSPA